MAISNLCHCERSVAIHFFEIEKPVPKLYFFSTPQKIRDQDSEILGAKASGDLVSILNSDLSFSYKYSLIPQ